MFVNVPSFSAQLRAGQHNIGKLCGLGKEDVLYDKKLKVP